MPSTTEQRFLSGSYAAVPDETTVVDLVVDTAPPFVPSGRYSRIGPTPAGNRRRPYKRSTGDGMLHPITVDSGSAVSYRDRWVKRYSASARLGTERVDGPPLTGRHTSPTRTAWCNGRTMSLDEGGPADELDNELDSVRRPPWPPYASLDASPLASTAPGSAGRSER